MADDGEERTHRSHDMRETSLDAYKEFVERDGDDYTRLLRYTRRERERGATDDQRKLYFTDAERFKGTERNVMPEGTVLAGRHALWKRFGLIRETRRYRLTRFKRYAIVWVATEFFDKDRDSIRTADGKKRPKLYEDGPRKNI